MPKTRSCRVVKQQQYRIDDDDDDDGDDVQVEGPQNYGGILAALNNANNTTSTDDSESNHEKNQTTTTTTIPVKSSKTLRGSRNQRPRKSSATSESDADGDSTPRKNKKNRKPTNNKHNNENELTPPPKSVVIGTLPCFSPPTHHPSQHQQQQQQRHYADDLQEHENENKNETHSHHHHNDDVSALSCLVSPSAKTQTAATSKQQRQQSGRDPYSAYREPSDAGSVSIAGSNSDDDDDEESESEDHNDDDDKTIPLAGSGDVRDPDPDETFLEGDSLEEEEQVEDDDEGENSEDSHDADSNDELVSEPEDDDTFESEEEMDDDDDDEEEEEYTPDDDEFDPEDDEDLSTQDELEDVVEEKPLTRRGRQRKQASPPKPTRAKASNKKVPAKKGQQKQPESPVSDNEMSMEAQSPMGQGIGMDTEDEATPMIKSRNSRKASVEQEKTEQTPDALNRSLEKSFNASSPESLVAVVCDDDDDDDADILEATILDDEAYSVVSAKSPRIIDMSQEVSDNDEEEENENDVSLIVDDDDQSYETDEETVAFGVDLNEGSVAQSNPVDVSTNLDDEPVQDIEPGDEAVDETVTMFAAVNLDHEPDEESEPVDVSVNLDVSINPGNEPIEEDKIVDASLDLDSEPVDETEESEPVDVSVVLDTEPVDEIEENESVDVPVNLDTESVDETEENKPVDVSVNLDTEPVDESESIDATRDETVPKFVTVTINNRVAHESEPIDDSGESAANAVSENNENMVANDQDGSHRNVEKGTPTKSKPKKESKRSKQNKSYHRHEGVVKRGKWTLGAKLGVGSFGVVHMGMDTMTGTLMAVKTFQMKRAVMKDVRREVELLRSLKHKNIVRYYGAEMDKTHLHVFQEWVPAGCVSSMLCRFGCFSMPVIRSYLSQTLSGLNYLHANHILHRDIKGSNLLVNDEGVVKLADFGASKRLANLQADLMMSMTVRGTPYFMAPEVFEEKYSSKADIWGVGCVAYQMATGSPPWKDQGLSNPISLFNYIKRQGGAPSITYGGDAEQLSEGEMHVRTLFEAFMEKCYHQDPSKRPTARALMEDPFFTELHHGLDEARTPCRGLFSPCSDTSTRSGSPPTNGAFSPPFLGSPSPTKESQSRSVVQWKQSFRSPPKQSFRSPPKSKRKNIIGSPSPMRASPMRASPMQASPMRIARSPLPRSPFRPSASKGLPSASKCSPSTDSSDWPTWARERHLKLKKEQSTSQGTQQITELLDSLAMSEDSNPLYGIGPNPFRRKSATNGKTTEGSTMLSNLDGLKLLDQSEITYEI